MLLIVRQEAGLSYTDVGLLAGIFYGVSGVSRRRRRASRSTASAPDRSWPAASLSSAVRLP